MSIKIMTLVWDVTFPCLPAKMIALKLADCASDDGDCIFPSSATLSRTTGCARSTILKWLFAMEHCGLVRVIERSAGGASGKTTTRAFDVELLRRLVPPPPERDPKTGRRSRPEPELRLVQSDIERIGENRDLVRVPVFEIEATCPRDGRVRATDGSTRRTLAVRGTDGRGPPDGHDSSYRTVREPPTQGAGATGSDWIETLRHDDIALDVVEHLIEPIVAALAPPAQTPSPLELLRDLRNVAANAGASPRALARAAELIRAERVRLPRAADLPAFLERARADVLIKIAYGDARWEAWVSHEERQRGQAHGQHIARQQRWPICHDTDWPPPSPEIAEPPPGFAYDVAPEMPEWWAWLAAMQRCGMADAAQSALMGRRALRQPTRWPETTLSRTAEERAA